MISFIVPTKNEEKVIKKILQCLSSYHGEKEIIVSDGQSTDNTVLIAKKYAKVLEHKETERQKISEGKNKGASIAQGEYLVFIDADVYIPDINSFFPKTLQIFESNKDLVGLTVPIRVFRDQETFADKIIFSILNFCNFILNNYFKKGAAIGEFQMIKRGIFQKAKGYNENLVAGEDYEFFNRIAKIGKTYFAKDLTIYHTGRRAHKIGWPKLLMEWFFNYLSAVFRGGSYSKEWEVIR
ncbi:MAG: glycosyltransferase [Candidatus Paceibacterota bacterium]